MTAIRLIQFLGLKKVRLPLIILNTGFFLTGVVLLLSHDLHGRSAGRGFTLLGFTTLLLLQMPFYYSNWTQHKKEASDLRAFWVIMGIFLFGFLSSAILFFASAAS
jgi:hypothetical protein